METRGIEPLSRRRRVEMDPGAAKFDLLRDAAALNLAKCRSPGSGHWFGRGTGVSDLHSKGDTGDGSIEHQPADAPTECRRDVLRPPRKRGSRRFGIRWHVLGCGFLTRCPKRPRPAPRTSAVCRILASPTVFSTIARSSAGPRARGGAPACRVSSCVARGRTRV